MCSRRLTDCGDESERVEKARSEAPLMLMLRVVDRGGAFHVRGLDGHAVAVAGEALDDALLELEHLLRGQPRPVFLVQNVEILRDAPKLLHRLRANLVVARLLLI